MTATESDQAGAPPAVQTVRGPVPVTELGRVFMHEHVFVLNADVQQNYPEEWGDEDQRVADAVRKLSQVRDAGIATIVDPTVPGLGRYIPRIRRVADAADLNIIVATGIYAFMELPNFLGYRTPRAIALASIETGAPVMVHTNAPERTGLLALENLATTGSGSSISTRLRTASGR